MKRIINIIFVSLLIIFITSITTNVSAASEGFNVRLQPNKSTYTKGEEVIISVILTQAPDNGINAIGGEISYNKENLKYDKIVSKNGWGNATYNESTGKFTLTLSGTEFSKSNVEMFQIVFIAQTDNVENVSITLNDIEAVAIGDNISSQRLVTQESASTSIKIETATTNVPNDDEQKDDDNEEQDENNNGNNNGNGNNENQNGNNNNGSINNNNENDNDKNNGNNNNDNNAGKENTLNNNKSSNKIDNSIYNGDNGLPQTGTNNLMIVILSIIAVILIIAIFAVGYKRGKRSM